MKLTLHHEPHSLASAAAGATLGDVSTLPKTFPDARQAAISPTALAQESGDRRARPGHRLWHLGSSLQWALCDALAGFASMLLAFRISPAGHNFAAFATHARPNFAAGCFAATAFLSSYVLGLNQVQNFRSRFRILVLTLALSASTVAFTSLITSFVFYKQIGRYILLYAFGGFFSIEACIRLLWRRQMTGSVHRLIIWGDVAFSAKLESILARSAFPIDIVAAFRPDPSNVGLLRRALDRREVHEIVVHGTEAAVREILLESLDRGVAVSTMDTFAERHFSKIPSDFIAPEWFFQVDLKQHHPFFLTTKRLLDVAVSLAGAVVALPLIGLAAVLIKLDGGGKVFYSQVRVGLNQKPFTIRKLRSMRVDSEVAGPQWAKVNDERVTRIGRFLRRTRIDELPQLWNVLRGDMAFVGPRPERPEFVERLAATIPFYRQRHLIKPGITGWAQICFPYGASREDAIEKLSYDLYYLKNASLLLDVQIMMQTLTAVARGSR
jgi:exopolysaccharide biosynthesis polyprenyl glycosylphosphotransferase